MKMLCFMLSNYFPVDYISVDVSDRILALIFFVYDLSYSIILRSMAVSSGARRSGEAAKTRANEGKASRPNLLTVFLTSPAFITLRAQPKPRCYAGYYSIKLLITDKNLSLKILVPLVFSEVPGSE